MKNNTDHSLSLLSDLYQLTMAYGYYRNGTANRRATFHLTYRKPPFGGQYAIACGLNAAIDFLDNLSFSESDLDYIAKIPGADGNPIFNGDFVDFLRESKFECDVLGMPEGTIAFPHEPLLRVEGPLWQCQYVETALLTILNFQTLIATKASRICQAAEGDPVLEFGLRRAQGIDGGVSASRAAYVGGCVATSNMLTGKIHDVPIRGTHAHSWVMAFESEIESFETYANVMPNNCVFLVDTYDTIEGVKRAIEVGKTLKEKGQGLLGIRLDSGDLVELSIAARKLLDEAGFENANVVASNDLDEYRIRDLKNQGAKINVWGVGTRLATAYDQPALGGVYKLGAIHDDQENWQPRIKLSEEPIKVSNPGIQQVYRVKNGGKIAGDFLINELSKSPELDIVCPKTGVSKVLEGENSPLLVPIFEKGRLCHDVDSAENARSRAMTQLADLDQSVTRLENPEPFFVGMDSKMYNLKMQLISTARDKDETS